MFNSFYSVFGRNVRVVNFGFTRFARELASGLARVSRKDAERCIAMH